MYTRVYQEETLLTIGCQFKCLKVTIVCELLHFTYSLTADVAQFLTCSV